MSSGYTFKQIDDAYNTLVDTYKAIGFKEVLNSVKYFNNTYGCTELVFNNKTIKVVLERVSHSDSRFSYPVSCVQLKLERPEAEDVVYQRFYYVDGNYYVTDLNEVQKIRNLQFDRFLNRNNNTALYCNIRKNKLSDNTLSFLKNRIEAYLSKNNRPITYQLMYVYISYRNLERRLVIVIKHDDSAATEAIYI